MLKFYIENYGCQMNLSEADSLRSILISNNYKEVNNPKDADIIILNTCSVRKTAEDRIEGRLGYYRGIKNNYNLKFKVILMGCMAQSIGKDLKEKFPDVIDIVWGTYNKDKVLNYLNEIDSVKNQSIQDLEEYYETLKINNYKFMESYPTKKIKYRSYVPISHGCNNYCSYCIVPYVRGQEVYRDNNQIYENIKKLIDNGVKEIILLGQNVNSYNYNNVRFPDLLSNIASKFNSIRISFLTSHPKDFSKEIVDVIINFPNIMKNIHLPLQSGNNRILKLMNRKYTIEEYFEKVEWIQSIPDYNLTTDILVGFPSETEDEFNDTIYAVKKIRFHDAFMYYYNPRPGTMAEKLVGQLSEKIKLVRLSKLIEIQNNIRKERLKESINKEYSVLIESVSKKNKNQLIGTSNNGLIVYLEGNKQMIGEIVKVNITEISGNGLFGVIKS